MSFNESQTKAILHNQKPMIVLAGPGSGKTTVITERTKNLIEQYGVNPAHILVITFTRASANEMKERFLKLIDETYSPVTFGTFHSVFFSVLKHAYRFTAANILKEEDKNRYLKEIIGRMEISIEDEADFISNVAAEISLIKNDRIKPDYYYSMQCAAEDFRKIYSEYERMLQNARLIDFDDMLVYCFELLTERKDILEGWQQKFQYILIDEFQDINRIQYDIIKLLAKPQDNLFIVGDDDQSIYRFRGARPEIMLNFNKDYPNAQTVLLNVNYRSTGAIVEGALRVIANNEKRFKKEIMASKERGKDIIYKIYPSQKEENMAILQYIKGYMKSGGKFSDIAVLFRTNTQPGQLLQKFMEYNVPFRIKDYMPNLYDHWIAKNIFSYIKIAMGVKDRSEFLNIMNRPKRYISRQSMEKQEISFEDLKQFYKDTFWMKEYINGFEHDIHMLSNMAPYAAVTYIRKGIGYDNFIREYAESRKINSEDLYEILDELQENARGQATFQDWFDYVAEYTLKLEEKVRERNSETDSVSMSTMHSAKGLEYQVVFILDANEGIIPYKKAALEEEIEEERRMFYVAATRAKEYLFVFSVKERYGKSLEISRFAGEMRYAEEEFKEGVTVRHAKYKEGIIIGVDGNKLKIEFKKSRKKITVDRQYCLQNRLLEII